jgi:hypothetical protein
MIPDSIIAAINTELNGMNFGKVILEISVHDKQPKFRIVKEISVIPGKPTSGAEK